MLLCPANAPDTGTYPPWQLCLLITALGDREQFQSWWRYTLVSSSLFPPTVAFDGFHHLYFFYYYWVAGRRTNKRMDAILREYSLWGNSVVFQCHSDLCLMSPLALAPWAVFSTVSVTIDFVFSFATRLFHVSKNEMALYWLPFPLSVSFFIIQDTSQEVEVGVSCSLCPTSSHGCFLTPLQR